VVGLPAGRLERAPEVDRGVSLRTARDDAVTEDLAYRDASLGRSNERLQARGCIEPCSGGRLGRYRNRQLGQQRPLGGELEYFFRHYWHNRQNNENLLRPGEPNPVSAPLANRRYATNYIRAIRGKHEQEREELMAIYITQGRYTPDAVKGMVANPENREKAVADLMEKAGAKLLAHYFTFGEYDFLSIAEAPNEEVKPVLELEKPLADGVKTEKSV
jgi:uncharacterized protein with GYD domain